jgi:drug/metabolite transporter (DMT)-like permease
MAFVAIFLLEAESSIGALAMSQVGTLIFIALSTGMVALLIYYRGLKNTPVSVSTILELFYPLIAVVIDIFLYDNVLASSQYIAALVLLFAMYKVGKIANRL